jgi:hypothetical protein
MTWLLRSSDQSLRAMQARRAWVAGIICDPGRRALWALGEFVELKPEEVWHKEEESAAAGGELPRGQGEVGAVGDGLDGGPRAVRSFFVEASGQGGNPSCLSTSRTAVGLSRIPSSRRVSLISYTE